MTVKRYEFNDSVMSEFEDGQYVTYSDYQKLVAENAVLKHAILETQGGIELASAAINDDKRGDTFRDILNAIYMKTNAETPATCAAIAEIKLPLAAEVDAYRAFIEDLGIIHSMKAPETDHLLSYYEALGADKMFNLVEPAVRNFCNPVTARLVLEELAILATDLRAGRKG